MEGFFEKRFALKEHKTDVRTEVLAGMTTFMTMSYILAVNPIILSEAGMDKGAVFTTTILSAIIATLIMAFYANYPFALAPGMGLNAYFAYTVVIQKGFSFEFALTAIFLEGLLFLLLSLFKVREAIFEAIPMNLKKAVSAGIGLFIAMIGAHSAGLITEDANTLVTLGDLGSPGVLLTLLGLLIIGFLYGRGIKGALFYGIFITTLVGLLVGITPWPTRILSLPPSIAPIFMKLDFSKVLSFDMAMVVFTFLFVDIFDTVGTLVGVSTKAGMLDREGKLPRVGRALMADAVGTTCGAILGTSTVTTFVESSAGVADGGRTGLTALSTAGMFLISLLFAPLILVIPPQATAPALIMVGIFMMGSVVEINFYDITEALPAFLTIAMMPFGYSIATGIEFGMVSYVIMKVLAGKHREVSLLMYVLASIFILKEVVSRLPL